MKIDEPGSLAPWKCLVFVRHVLALDNLASFGLAQDTQSDRRLASAALRDTSGRLGVTDRVPRFKLWLLRNRANNSSGSEAGKVNWSNRDFRLYNRALGL